MQDAGILQIVSRHDGDVTPKYSRLREFAVEFGRYIGDDLRTHGDIEAAAVHDFRAFWKILLESSRLRWSGDPEPVCVGSEVERAKFFRNVSLNYADNILSPDFPDDRVCLTAIRADGRPTHLTRAGLRARVEHLAGALRQLGLAPGDRVAAVTRNGAEAVVAALAVTALGGVYSSASPEMGVDAIIERFSQIGPSILVANLAPSPVDAGLPVAERIAAVARALPSLTTIVCLDDPSLLPDMPLARLGLDALLSAPPMRQRDWPALPFNHPLFVMFSSGTTGRPKCIVHAAGGVLLEHIKEHRLHGDMGGDDSLFFHTSCAWMMWNWQLTALASGVRIVVYEGAVSHARTLWQIVSDHDVTLFGTGPTYLRICSETGFVPAGEFRFRSLRTVYSTGSILLDEQFGWVRDNVKDVPVQSISGGTDIIGCFVLGSPLLPVRDGECQCRSLAMDVRALGASEEDPVGELICANPFPSRPLGFLNDADGHAFHGSYFARNPGVWTHGDLISFSPSGGARLHGRSDGILNVRGIRVGPAEIYRIVLGFRVIKAAMAVEQVVGGEMARARLLLLVVLREGEVLSPSLTADLRDALLQGASAAHVPELIVAVPGLPLTHSGKQSEAALTDALNGRPVRNRNALANPACLDEIVARVAQSGPRPDAPDPLPAVPHSDADVLSASLLRLWETTLSSAPIGLDDNFFHLGGNSLLAARILTEVGRMTGRDLPLNTLLAAPTVRALADLLQVGERGGNRQLVPLRKGGTGAPFFMIHSLSGNVLELWSLPHRMKTTRPVYGIEAQGLDGGEPGASIREIARSYIALIKSVQPDGPYSIGGYSLGGLIAFEIAQDLVRAGDRVDVVVLIDTLVHPRALPFVQRLAYYTTFPLRHPLQIIRAPARERLGHIRRRIADKRDQGLLPAEVRRVRKALLDAMRDYRPTAFDGRLMYIRPRIVEYNSTAFWTSIVTGRFDLRVTDGDHRTMMTRHVDSVVSALDEALAF